MTTLFVYGDSYSDSNERTRQSNGPLWSENLAHAWDVTLKSFAANGAVVCPKKNAPSDLSKQLRAAKPAIEAASAANEKNVHAVFIGATDVADLSDRSTKIDAWADCIKEHVLELHRLDPNADIILVGLPPLEFAPFFSNNTSHQSIVKQRTQRLNVALEDGADTWHSQFMDIYTVFSYLLEDPAENNINNVESAYWETCQGLCQDPVDEYLWYDRIHMTGAGHRAISKEIISRMPFEAKELPPPRVIPPTTHDPISPESSTSADQLGGESILDGDYHLSSWILLVVVCLFILFIVRPARLSNMFRGIVRSRKHNKRQAEYSVV